MPKANLAQRESNGYPTIRSKATEEVLSCRNAVMRRMSTAESHSQEQHRSRRLRFQADAVIHRILQPLLTVKITLSRLDGHVPKQELYLFKLPARLVTQASASSSEVMRSDRAKAAI